MIEGPLTAEDAVSAYLSGNLKGADLSAAARDTERARGDARQGGVSPIP